MCQKSTAARKFRNTASWLTRCGQTTLAAGTVGVLLLLWAGDAMAAATVPLPRPRPEGAPGRTAPPPAGAEAPEAQPAAPPGEAAPPAAGQDTLTVLTPCRLALTEAIAIAPSVPPIRGPGACGGEDLVRLEAVVLPDGRRVALKPAATLRCTMARAIADWVRTDLVALGQGLGSAPAALDNFDAYECRGRNRVAGAILSEHGKANALDVRAITLDSGRVVALTDRTEPRAVREQVLRSVCARFATVLGPGSDWSHEDHIHLDLAERRSGFRICQWGVYDPLPAMPPALPAARPPEAPPRVVAGHRDGEEGAADEGGAEGSTAGQR